MLAGLHVMSTYVTALAVEMQTHLQGSNVDKQISTSPENALTLYASM